MELGELPKERKWIVIGAVGRVLTRQKTVCADDLHQELSAGEYPWDRRAFGAVLRGMQERGILEPVRYVKSGRGECHGRPIVLFREVRSASDSGTRRME